MNNFKIGDVVYLKSGSDAMTITYIEKNNHYKVTWIDKSGKPHYGSYPKEALTKENPMTLNI